MRGSPSAGTSSAAGGSRVFLVVLTGLLAVYATWLCTFWPGVLGHDSFAVLRQVEQPDAFTSGKPAFWYGLVALFYRTTRLVEVPIGMQFLFAAVVFARVLGWQWCMGLRAVFWLSLAWICLAPHMVFYLGLLYPDGIFSVAAAGLLFELWLAARRGGIDVRSLAMIALTLPVALFARSNGLVFVLPLTALWFLVDKKSRGWLATIVLLWCAVVALGARLHHDKSQGIWFPLAIFETVNVLHTRGESASESAGNLSPATIAALTRHRPLGNYVDHFRPDYWDPLVHDPDGPQVGRMDEADQQVIVQQFLRHNLWHNFSEFIASRVNVFAAAATARAGIVEFWWAKPVLENLATRSVYRRWRLTKVEQVLTAVHDFGVRHRAWLWSPLPGIGLMLLMLMNGLRNPKRHLPSLLVTVPMTLQLGAIFVFSTAGEYRYLLPFFVQPLVVLPVWAMGARRVPG